MNFKEIFQQITPFLIACPLFALAMLYYLFVIWKEGGTSIMLLPQVLIFLTASILFLVFDRMLVKHGQGLLTIIEAVAVVFIYLAIQYSAKSLTFQPAKEVTHFWVVHPVEENQSTKLEATSPFTFHRQIQIEENDQIVYLSQKTIDRYKLKVQTSTSYTSSGELHQIEGRTVRVDFYGLKHKNDMGKSSSKNKELVLKKMQALIGN